MCFGTIFASCFGYPSGNTETIEDAGRPLSLAGADRELATLQLNNLIGPRLTTGPLTSGTQLICDRLPDSDGTAHAYPMIDGKLLLLNLGTPEKMAFRPLSGQWTFEVDKGDPSTVIVKQAKGDGGFTRFFVDTTQAVDNDYLEIHPYIPATVNDGVAAVRGQLRQLTGHRLICSVDNSHGTAFLTALSNNLDLAEGCTPGCFHDIANRNIPIQLHWRQPNEALFTTYSLHVEGHDDTLLLVNKATGDNNENNVFLYPVSTPLVCLNCEFVDGQLSDIYLNGYRTNVHQAVELTAPRGAAASPSLPWTSGAKVKEQ